MTRVKPWLLLAVIFIVGIVTGWALTMGLAPHSNQPPGEQQMKTHWMMRLTNRLNLTADQQAKIEPIVTDAEDQIQSVHRDELGRTSQILEDANRQIAAILTPEQQVELKKMETEREKQFSGHMRSWAPRGGPGEGPRGGPGGMPPRGGPDGERMPPPDGGTNSAPPSRPQ